MATDSTELTFVRCPSCRSLVPAVSSRCRMCGSALEAVTRAGADEKNSATGRARQKTVNKSAAKQDQQAAPEKSKSAVADDEQFEAQESVDELAQDTPPIDDPLSAYVEEVDAIEGQSQQHSPSVSASTNRQSKSPVVTLDDEIEPAATASEFDVVKKPSTISKKVADTSALDADDDWPDEYSQESPEVEFQAAPPKAKAASPAHTSNGNGQNVGKPQQPGQAKHQPNGPQSKPPASPEKHQAPVAAKSAAPTSSRQLRDATENEPTDSVQVTQAARPASMPQKQKEQNKSTYQSSQEGRLVGWLVSFNNSTGKALELREGKSFVTSAGIKPNDFVLADSSVSAPHAMLSVSLQSGLIVQDLMSEHGVHIKRVGDNHYQLEEEVVQLEHGDWLRFGMLEFLVIIVPEFAYRE